MCTYYYEINNEKAPFDNPKVREALKLSLDRDIMVNKVKAQGDTPAFGFTPPFADGMSAKEPEWFANMTQDQRNEKHANCWKKRALPKINH